MGSKHATSITEYIAWLFKEYYKLKQEVTEKAGYRLIKIDESNSGRVELTIQLIGKTTTFKATPEEILADDALTELFSAKDIRTITYFACQQIKKPKSQLVLKRFCEKLNRIVFGVSNVIKQDIEEKTAQDISLDKDLIKNLSPEDAHIIGFTAASEHEVSVEIEKALLRKQRGD
jgi:hypothetical protein